MGIRSVLPTMAQVTGIQKKEQINGANQMERKRGGNQKKEDMGKSGNGRYGELRQTTKY